MPGLMVAKNMGNMYCGSLYGGLASLLSNVSPEELVINYLTLAQ
jgi:hydroxymethylglutaryl-CoA synthase